MMHHFIICQDPVHECICHFLNHSSLHRLFDFDTLFWTKLNKKSLGEDRLKICCLFSVF
jgi:hypothetical protein